MKKTIAVVVMLAAALTMVSAKSSKKYSFTAGVHALGGIGFGSFDEDLEKKIKDNAGLSKGLGLELGGGAWVNLPLYQGLCIQPEVNYMYNTATLNTDDTTLGITTKTTETKSYSSLDIAALFTYKVQSINFLVGPTISIPVSKMKSVTTGTSTAGAVSTAINNENEKDISNITFGLQAGANTNIRFGLGQIVAGARFMMDFNPTQNTTTSGSTTTTTDLYKRMGVIAEVGYRFAF